jgi:hypothetical protein
MKKTILLYLLLGVSISLSAQGIKDKFFHQIGFSLYTDFFYSQAKEHTANANVEDFKGNLKATDISGQYRSSEIALISFYYSPSFNIIEKGVENSYSINIPIGIHISDAKKEFQGDYYNGSGNSTYYYYSEHLGSISFPVYLTWNTGMGATYASEKETGFSLGLGLDNRMQMLLVQESTDYNSSLNSKMPAVSSLPSLMLGYRRWKGEKAKEIKLKLSYLPSSVSGNTVSTFNNGFAVALSFNKFLNF